MTTMRSFVVIWQWNLVAHEQNRRLKIAPLLLLAVTMLNASGLSGVSLLAKEEKAKPAAKQQMQPLEQPPVLELPSLPFDVEGNVTSDVYIPDPDETQDGKARVAIVSARARELYQEYDVVDKERRPLAANRDLLYGEMRQLAARINEADAKAKAANGRIFILQQQIAVANNNNLRNELLNCQQVVANMGVIIQNSSDGISARQPKLDALNIAIKPLDNRLQKLWTELNACRKQWLELRVPHEKYARSDFEQLKLVIDDWVIVDGRWPDALCWSALCSYELEDYEKADEMAEKANQIRAQVLGSPKAWSQLEALQGLVAFQIPRQKRKSITSVEKAMGHFDKEKDWVTPFIAGRATREHKHLASKAKAYFERALKIKPNCTCAKFHLGVLQTTTNETNVRDIAGGIKLLESVWTRTGKRSWRTSVALAEAYEAAERQSDAKGQWEIAITLAPERERAKLISRRNQ